MDDTLQTTAEPAARQGNGSDRLKANRRARPRGESPLDYMLRVMRDEAADPERRDEMAKTAAPYVHGKLATTNPGDVALSTHFTGMRQALAAKLDRILAARATPEPCEPTDG